MLDVFSSYSPALLAFLVAILLIAGVVRGFAGFGAGMIFMPVATSLIHPATAAAAFLFIDGIVALPLIVRAARICDWSTVLPAVVGAVLSVHLGAWLLANTDVLVLRWAIFAIVTGLLALLISGWRYQGKPTRPVSLGVGATAGVLGGISQVSGPPVVAFWLSSAKAPAIVRANLIMFFALASAGTFIAYIVNGFFTIEVWHLLTAAVPTYALGIFLGSRGFRTADPKYYRWIAYGLIGLAAVSSIPLLDVVLR
ncbi:sulfite exporter TauE/SafE family protein [Roseibium sp. RKSG952]|uniref:sulfite exporter TauE/SafE family protein n=1 Tax=Roseibium sp. RKSG952 TaxID=2529384 RepID=UPI0012BD7FFA|nr:sulfite exporter TauE/SafE family protein [Roseibium sp. RKSG952]MTH98051.1 sulfite exporter TauE/SafE family protein [Roseibium sp. RKSG952]